MNSEEEPPEELMYSWEARFDQGVWWIDGEGTPHRIADLAPDRCLRILHYLHRNADGITGTIQMDRLNVRMPDVDTAAYDSVASDTAEDAQMVQDPRAWMVDTELVFSLRAHAGTLPLVKERLTMAFEARRMGGPQVDKDLGVEEPTVDMWEAGKLIPTPDQVRRVARYTEFPLPYFYTPLNRGGPVAWACVGRGRSRRRVPIELSPPPRAQSPLF